MPLKILIAEDSATNRLLFSMTMKRLGHAADIAVNGMEACQLFRGTHYDLVFLDLNMPVADGIRAAMEINRNNPRGARDIVPSSTLQDDPHARRRAEGNQGP